MTHEIRDRIEQIKKWVEAREQDGWMPAIELCGPKRSTDMLILEILTDIVADLYPAKKLSEAADVPVARIFPERVSVIQGKIRESDGSVLADYFERFGASGASIPMMAPGDSIVTTPYLFDGWAWTVADQHDAARMAWGLCALDDGQIMVSATPASELDDGDTDQNVRRLATGDSSFMQVKPTAEQLELCRRAVLICQLSERATIGDRAVKAFAEANARVHAIADQPGRFARDVEAAKVPRDILAPIVDEVV